MNEIIVNHLDVALDALQDITFDFLDIEEHVTQLEAENQNLADQILELEDELEGYRNFEGC